MVWLSDLFSTKHDRKTTMTKFKATLTFSGSKFKLDLYHSENVTHDKAKKKKRVEIKAQIDNNTSINVKHLQLRPNKQLWAGRKIITPPALQIKCLLHSSLHPNVPSFSKLRHNEVFTNIVWTLPHFVILQTQTCFENVCDQHKINRHWFLILFTNINLKSVECFCPF